MHRSRRYRRRSRQNRHDLVSEAQLLGLRDWPHFNIDVTDPARLRGTAHDLGLLHRWLDLSLLLANRVLDDEILVRLRDHRHSCFAIFRGCKRRKLQRPLVNQSALRLDMPDVERIAERLRCLVDFANVAPEVAALLL